MSNEDYDKRAASAGSVPKTFYRSWLTWVGLVLAIAILGSVLSAAQELGACPDETNGGWVKQTVPVSLFMMGFGSLFAVGAGNILRNAWTKSPDEYLDWLRQLKKSKLANFWLSILPGSYPVWNDRIVSILGIAMGAFVVWVGAYSLWRNIFCG